METVRSTPLSRLEGLLARLVAADPTLSQNASRLMRPLRLLDAMGPVTEGALGDTPWEAEQLRGLLFSAIDGTLLPVALSGVVADENTGPWFPDEELLVLPSVGLIALAAGRLGCPIGQGPACRDAIFSLALAVAVPESLLRAEALGADDSTLGLMLANALGSGAATWSRALVLVAGDPAQRARYVALAELWTALDKVAPVDLTSAGLPQGWMGLATQRLLVDDTGLTLSTTDTVEAVWWSGESYTILTPESGTSPLRWVRPSTGGWVGVFDPTVAQVANRSRTQINISLAMMSGSTAASLFSSLSLPMVREDAGLAPAPVSLYLPEAPVVSEEAGGSGFAFHRLLFGPVCLDETLPLYHTPGPSYQRTDAALPSVLPVAPDALHVIPYAPADRDDPLIERLFGAMARFVLEASELSDVVVELRLPRGGLLVVRPAEGARALVISGPDTDDAAVEAAVRALPATTEAARRYLARLVCFDSGRTGLLPGRIEERRALGSGGAQDSPVEVLALDAQDRVIGRRRLSVIQALDEGTLHGGLLSLPSLAVAVEFVREGQSLHRVEAPAADATVTLTETDRLELATGQADCAALMVSFEMADRTLLLPWRCLRLPVDAFEPRRTELLVEAELVVRPEDGWAATPWMLPSDDEIPDGAVIRADEDGRLMFWRSTPDGEGGVRHLWSGDAMFLFPSGPVEVIESRVTVPEGETGTVRATVTYGADSEFPELHLAARDLDPCCLPETVTQDVLLYLPSVDGTAAEVDLSTPVDGLSYRVHRHPHLVEDRLAALPRWPTSPDDPLTDEIIAALSAACLRTAGGEEALWLVVLDGGGAWRRLQSAAGAKRLAICTAEALPDLLAEVGAAADPVAGAPVSMLRLSGHRYQGGRLLLCEQREEQRAPGGAEPVETGLVARQRDAAGRLLSTVTVNGPIRATPQPFSALLPLSPATQRVELCDGETVLRSLEVAVNVLDLGEVTLADDTLTVTLADETVGMEGAPTALAVDLLFPLGDEDDPELAIGLTCGDVTAALPLGLGGLSAETMLRLSIAPVRGSSRGRSRVVLAPPPAQVLTYRIRRLDPGRYAAVGDPSGEVSWMVAQGDEERWEVGPEINEVAEGAGVIEARDPEGVADRRVLGLGCACGDTPPTLYTFLFRPDPQEGAAAGEVDLNSPALPWGFRCSALTLPLVRADRLVVLPRPVEDGDDPLVGELLCALVDEALATVGGEVALWLAVVAGEAPWHILRPSTAAFRVGVCSEAGLADLIAEVGALALPVATLPAPAIRLAGRLFGAGRFLACALWTEDRQVPGQTEPVETGLVARLLDRRGRLLSAHPIGAADDRQPAPVRALLPRASAATRLELWVGERLLRSEALDFSVDVPEDFSRDGSLLTWGAPPEASEGARVVESVRVALQPADWPLPLTLDLVCGPAFALQLALPLHRYGAWDGPEVVIFGKAGAVSRRISFEDSRVSEGEVGPYAIRRLDEGEMLLVGGPGNDLLWTHTVDELDTTYGTMNPLTVEDGAGTLAAQSYDQRDVIDLSEACPCGDPLPRVKLVVTAPWVDDGDRGVGRVSEASVRSGLLALQKQLGVSLLPVLSLAWVEASLAVVEEAPTGPGDPLVAELADRLELRSLRSEGADDALWVAVLPGEEDWLLARPAQSSRTLLVGTLSGVLAWIEGQIEALIGGELPAVAGAVSAIVLAEEAAPVEVIEVESRPRRRYANPPAGAGDVRMRLVSAARSGPYADVAPLLPGSSRLFAALLPAARKISALEIALPREILRVSAASVSRTPRVTVSRAGDLLRWQTDHPQAFEPMGRLEAAVGGLWTPVEGPLLPGELPVVIARLGGATALRVSLGDGWQRWTPASLDDCPPLPDAQGRLRCLLRLLPGDRVLADTVADAPPNTEYRLTTATGTHVQVDNPVFVGVRSPEALEIWVESDTNLVQPLTRGPRETVALATMVAPTASLDGWARRVALTDAGPVGLRMDSSLFGREGLAGGAHRDIAEVGGQLYRMDADGRLFLGDGHSLLTADSGGRALRSDGENLLLLRRDGSARRLGADQKWGTTVHFCCTALRDAAPWEEGILAITQEGKVRFARPGEVALQTLAGLGDQLALRVYAAPARPAWIWLESGAVLRVDSPTDTAVFDSADSERPREGLVGAIALEVDPASGRYAWVDRAQVLRVDRPADAPDLEPVALAWPPLDLIWRSGQLTALIGMRRDHLSAAAVEPHGLD